MYDKKQALGFILIIMVVMTYTQFVFAPNQPQHQQQQQVSATAPGSTQTSDFQNQPISPSQTGSPNQITGTGNQILSGSITKVPSLEEVSKAPKTIVHSGLSTISITHLGGRVKNLALDNFHKELKGSEPFDMISPLEGSSLPGALQSASSTDEGLLYELKAKEGFEQLDAENLKTGPGVARLTFTATSASGQVFTKIFEFTSSSYLLSIKGSISPALSANDTLSISWPIFVDKEALAQSYDPYFFSILSETNKVSHIPAISDLSTLSNPQSVQWLAFGDRYFGTALLPTERQQKNIQVVSNNGLFNLFAKGNQNSVAADIFAGPKIYQLLKGQGLQLERTIDLGFFSFVAYPLLQLLKFFFSIFGNYGVAIVALTLLVKTIFYPLNKASLKSMRAMQELGPEINALKERIKDSTQLNQEMLALYKRKGVNPMGGCLPVVIQIPVFFGLYSALQNAVELRHAPFALWVKDLATPERLEIFGINFPLMVLTMGAIMFLQQYLTPMPNMDPNQRKITLGMSLVFTLMFLIFPFPAGLAIYMLVNTAISLVQQQCLKSETLNKPFQMTLIASAAILMFAYIFSRL